MPYRTLDPDRIVATLERLESRIDERFPGRGLGKVCAELTDVAQATKARAAKIAQANLSHKIWQKITLIRDVEEPVNGGAERAPAAGGADKAGAGKDVAADEEPAGA
jgi:hypothetical protein